MYCDQTVMPTIPIPNVRLGTQILAPGRPKAALRFDCNWVAARVVAALAFTIVLLLVIAARAQETDPERAFTGAIQLFQGGWYDRAEKELGAFAAAFPNSTNRNEAILLQAQS